MNKMKELTASEVYELLRNVKKHLYEAIRGESEGSKNFLFDDDRPTTFNISIIRGNAADPEENLLRGECFEIMKTLWEACNKIEYLEAPIVGMGTPVKLSDGRYQMPDGKIFVDGDPVEVFWKTSQVSAWERAVMVEEYDEESETRSFVLEVPDYREYVNPANEIIRYRNRPY